jgi:hypothetical protein
LASAIDYIRTPSGSCLSFSRPARIVWTEKYTVLQTKETSAPELSRYRHIVVNVDHSCLATDIGYDGRKDRPVLQTRRRLLQAATLWPVIRPLLGAHKEFWESKAPSEWSSEEKAILLAQSPWAREGVARFEAERKRERAYEGVARPGGGVPGAIPGERPGAATSVPIGPPPPPVPSTDTGQSVQFRVLARWESATPVRLAGGPALPETAQFYVIRLRGMPLLPPPKGGRGENVPDPNQGMLEAIERGTRIERKDKAAIACAHLLTGSGESANDLLLFFPRGADPITAGDKVVTLESRFGPFHLSVKFPLKDMMYKGVLAL